MTVGADHAAVDADVHCVGGGHRLQLGRGKVRLGNAVLVVKTLHHVELHTVAVVLAADGTAAQQDVQCLGGDRLAERLLPLLAPQMGQQVGDDQLRLALFADADLHGGAVLLHHHAL